MNSCVGVADRTVGDLIERRIRAEGGRPCVSAVDGELSYAQFGALVETIAAQLTRRNLVRGELVAVEIPRSALTVAAVLAVWRAGGAFLLIEPTLPELRRAELIRDAGVRLVVSARVRSGVVDDAVEIAERGEWRCPAEVVDPAELAYVIYTSGSTGKPKGVLGRHSSLLSVVRTAERHFGLRADDRVAMLAPQHVEAMIFEMIASLALGAHLVVPTEQQRLPGPELDRFLQHERVSVLVATPSRLREMNPDHLPALRVVICGGEDLPSDVAQRWAFGRTLVNSYGVSEATIASTYIEIDPDDTRRIPIGRTCDGSEIVVLDDALRVVPDGTPGELFIGGDGVTLGYLGRPELTAERFVEVGGRRMYRTGDRGVREADGLLYFLGRNDDQVQIGGFRVELGEIRAVLREHSAVHDCAVREDAGRLVAYVVGKANPDVAAMRRWLAERLPSYMVPSLFIPVDKLPLTSWGKVDFAALTLPTEFTGRNGDGGSLSETQAALGEIAADLLGLERFDSADLRADLFLLGMTSSLITRFVRRVAVDLGTELSPVDVFERPTVAELAGVVDRNEEG
ncbi:non-ribosomal peptide synthetase [Amycolatopsis sp. YIM 10]|uniref:non-ribosomal peptide synthetase n=1 Tax=Amycolatopsis sp. YIM 10 TaxID=2653857 RepID=UPI00128FE8DF|nr:non-ribosomal peptide synthetase [Amycolatopsis sp. YIM 10]QFU88719.1 Novobiocin biosynthesis protein H [Amycolatopsis sp. YIM 10]